MKVFWPHPVDVATDFTYILFVILLLPCCLYQQAAKSGRVVQELSRRLERHPDGSEEEYDNFEEENTIEGYIRFDDVYEDTFLADDLENASPKESAEFVFHFSGLRITTARSMIPLRIVSS